MGYELQDKRMGIKGRSGNGIEAETVAVPARVLYPMPYPRPSLPQPTTR